MKRALIVTLAATLVSCAGLLVSPDDPGALKAAKVTTRVVIALPTFFMVEAYLFRRKQAEHEYYLMARLTWAEGAVESATTRFELDKAIALYNQAARELNAYRSQVAAQQARTAANVQRIMEVQARQSEAQAKRTHEAQQQQLDAVMRPIEIPRSTYCTSQIIGNTVYTDCY